MYLRDTIGAIATPYGEGGIAIIRISGDDAFSIIEKIFKPQFEKFMLDSCSSHTLHYGKILSYDKYPVDEVLLGVFKSPTSYTGEDVLEINCHGGRIITKKILDTLIALGVRLAEPGEFTKRAFLNGRIDLSQAEAISDLISAKSDIAAKYSMNLLSGNFGRIVKEYQKELIEYCGLIEIELDFIEEDVNFIHRDTLFDKISNLNENIKRMVQSYSLGRLFKDGIKIAIIGKPNVGKSTILNALLCFDRAIVSDIPGTTRDFIEEEMHYNGMLFRFVDTAGLRFPDTEIEKVGIERAIEQMKISDIILYIFDLSQEYNFADWEYFNQIKNDTLSKIPIIKLIPVFNKIDLVQEKTINDFVSENIDHLSEIEVESLRISAKDSKDILRLKNRLIEVMSISNINLEDNHIVTNFRHRKALQEANKHLEDALVSIRNNESGEFISHHIRFALNSIGEIIGTVTNDDILNEIFSNFCIGK